MTHLTAHPLAEWDIAATKFISVDYGIGTALDDDDSFASHHGLIRWTRTAPGCLQRANQAQPMATVTVPNFFTAALMVAESNCQAQLPSRLATTLAARFDLIIRDDWPCDPGGTLTQIWARAFAERRGQAWFREMVRSSVSTLDGSRYDRRDAVISSE